VVLKVSENPLKPIAHKGRCYILKGSVNYQMTAIEIAEELGLSDRVVDEYILQCDQRLFENSIIALCICINVKMCLR